MKTLVLILAGLSALAACSGTRDQRIAVIDSSALRPDLTLPDTISRRDTSTSMSSRAEQPVSPMEQQPVARAAPTPAKPQTAAKRKPKPQRPAAPVDTSTRAYAPSVVADTAEARDTTRVDTTSTSVAKDTMSTPSAASDTATSSPDTSTHPSSPDTLATRADTAATTPSDTARPTVATTPAPSTGASAAARTLAAGTEIHTALDDSITSRGDTVGQTISAHVTDNVLGPDGRTLIAAGAPVRFTIIQLRSSKSKNSQGRFALRADGIGLNGELRPVEAEVQPISRELRGRGVTASDAAKVGGGAAAGAVLGRVIGGNTKGTVIGGVAGAAAGAVVASQTATRDVVVKAKTPVVIVLKAPLVTP